MIHKPKYLLDSRLLQIGGYLGFFSHLFYYFTWVYLIPQPYESLWLRLSCGLVSMPLILINYWPEKLKKFIPLYWNMFLMHVLTITCTYLTLKNDFSTMWMMTQVMALFTLSILIDEILVLFGNIIVGALIAILAFYAQGQNESINITYNTLDTASLALIPVILACSLLFNYTKKKGIAAQEKAKVLKSLAGSIAHEMRNPLSQIHGSLHFILRQVSALDKQLLSFLKDANKIAKSGLQVIDITMDAINEKPIDKKTFSIISAKEIVSNTLNEYAYTDSQHAKKLSFTGGSFKLLADPVIVKYILYNLIGNALYYVKTMPEANIVISLIPEKRQIEIRDTGPGIAPSALPKLFDSFYSSGKQGGTGLGLAYCKRSMTSLGGSIDCDSELGSYTAFTLTFPELQDVKMISAA